METSLIHRSDWIILINSHDKTMIKKSLSLIICYSLLALFPHFATAQIKKPETIETHLLELTIYWIDSREPLVHPPKLKLHEIKLKNFAARVTGPFSTYIHDKGIGKRRSQLLAKKTIPLDKPDSKIDDYVVQKDPYIAKYRGQWNASCGALFFAAVSGEIELIMAAGAGKPRGENSIKDASFDEDVFFALQEGQGNRMINHWAARTLSR